MPLRPILRVARRNIGRNRWRSLLVVALVTLPVAAMVGAATVLDTITPAAERSVTHRMGQADLLASPASSEATAAALEARLPAGSRIEPILAEEGRLVLPGTEASVTMWAMDPRGLAGGMLALVGGRLPDAGSEVAISAPVARLAGVGIGQTITLRDLGTRIVVGLVEDQFQLKGRIVLEDPSAAVAAATQGQALWLVGLPAQSGPGTVDQGAFVSDSGEPLFLLTTREQATTASAGVGTTIVVLGGLGLVDVALIVSAAFALSIRRRQRELGLLAATGAEPRHLAGTVIAEGGLLGLVGVTVGAVLGAAGALATSPWLDQLTDRRNPPAFVESQWIVVAGAMGLSATLVAALVPAWTAARVPVLVALSGRRPPSSPAARTLGIGILTIGAGIALTATGALMRLGRFDSLNVLLLLAGAVLGTLGLGACSPWLLEQLERPAHRLPLASRIALRDTARARSRNGPIVTALLAGFGATVAVAALAASQDAVTAANWRPFLAPDQILIQGEGVLTAGPEAAKALGAVAAGPVAYIGREDRFVSIFRGKSTDPNQSTQNIGVGGSELLRALHAESAAVDLANGAVILLAEKPAAITQVTLVVTDAAGAEVSRVALPARAVATGIGPGDLPEAVVSTDTAARLGLAGAEGGRAGRFVIRLDHRVTDADLGRAAAVAAETPDTWADASTGPARPGEAFRLVTLIASLLVALSVTGIAVALGEAESRPEQRSLLALGADPRLRRRIAAARAGVISVLAGTLAIPAGLLPVWGLLASRGYPLVVPVPEIVAALAVLPLLAVVATLFLSRPIPPWSAFREPA